MILPLGRCGSVGCALPRCPLVPLPCGSQAPPHVCRRPRRTQLVHSHVLPAAESPGPSSQLRVFSFSRDESRARRRGGQGRVRPAPGAGLGGAGLCRSWRRNRAMSLSVPSADPPSSQVPCAGSSGRQVSGRAGSSGLGLPRKVSQLLRSSRPAGAGSPDLGREKAVRASAPRSSLLANLLLPIYPKFGAGCLKRCGWNLSRSG